MSTPRSVWTLRRLLIGIATEEEIIEVCEDFRPLAQRLFLREVEDRQDAWDTFLCGRPDRDELVRLLAEIDPSAPPPDTAKRRRPANLADLRKTFTEIRWTWPGWLPSSRLAGIAAFEGLGKTRLGIDLARRIHHAMPWPDGQEPTFPQGTPTLWICADGNQDDLAEACKAMNLPDEAVFFNTFPEDPYGGTDLDDAEALANLNEIIAEVKPGLVFIDTLTNATRRDLCRQNEVKILMTPLKEIAQRHQVTIVPLLHLSKDGQALGRRIKGIVRTLLQIDCPDPEKPGRLKFWVEKTFAKKPPPLGLTMGDDGNTYDFSPPKAAAKNPVGRPSEARDKAREFILDTLKRAGDLKAMFLCNEWETKHSGDKNAFWRARDFMVKNGEITCEGKPLILHLLKGEAEDSTDPPLEAFGDF